MTWRRATLLLLTMPFLMAALCSKGPSSSVPDPDLDNIWPNEDGNWWSFSISLKTRIDFEDLTDYLLEEDLFSDDPEDVPSAPELAELADSIVDFEPGEVVEFAEGMYSLSFDGELTTQSGVTCQNLVEDLDWTGARSESHSSELLGRVCEYRPDLREALVRAFGDVLGGTRSEGPYFLHGYGWEKTSERIVSYADINADPSWLFLEANLIQSREFSLQLLPDFADDIWLRGRIHEIGEFEAGGQDYEKAVTCHYMIDYGASLISGDSPEGLGYMRFLDLGAVVYAPELGPVSLLELRGMVVLEDGVDKAIQTWKLGLVGSSESQ